MPKVEKSLALTKYFWHEIVHTPAVDKAYIIGCLNWPGKIFIDTLHYITYIKRFYTRGALRSIMKSQPLIVIGWDPWFKRRVLYLSCIDGKGEYTTFTIVLKMPHYLLIYYKISLTYITEYTFHFLLKNLCIPTKRK